MHYLKLNIDIDDIKQRLCGFDLPVKELEYEDFLLGDPLVFTANKLNSVQQRLNDGKHKAFGIIEGGRLIYSTWIGLEILSLPVKSKHTLTPEEGLLEDSYCNIEARGRGLHYKMNLFRVHKLYELGKQKVIAIVMDGNEPAFKVQYKTGFQHYGTFRCGKIFGFSFSTLKKSYYDN